MKSTKLYALINRLQVYVCSAVKSAELLSRALDRIISVVKNKYLESVLSMGKVEHVM
jgi:hypothetical protein